MVIRLAAVVILSLIAVRWVTQPLSSLAKAAESEYEKLKPQSPNDAMQWVLVRLVRLRLGVEGLVAARQGFPRQAVRRGKRRNLECHGAQAIV